MCRLTGGKMEAGRREESTFLRSRKKGRRGPERAPEPSRARRESRPRATREIGSPRRRFKAPADDERRGGAPLDCIQPTGDQMRARPSPVSCPGSPRGSSPSLPPPPLSPAPSPSPAPAQDPCPPAVGPLERADTILVRWCPGCGARPSAGGQPRDRCCCCCCCLRVEHNSRRLPRARRIGSGIEFGSVSPSSSQPPAGRCSFPPPTEALTNDVVGGGGLVGAAAVVVAVAVLVVAVVAAALPARGR